MQNMFDSKGQINASNMADVLVQLSKVAAILQDNQPANVAMSGRPDLSDETRDGLISRAMNTQEGKIALAQSMANPIPPKLGLSRYCA